MQRQLTVAGMKPMPIENEVRMNRSSSAAIALTCLIGTITALWPLIANASPPSNGVDSGVQTRNAWYEGESILLGSISVPKDAREISFDLSDDQKTIFIYQHDVRPGIESRLITYDISDLRSPHLLSTLNVPELTSVSNAEMEHRGDRLFLFSGYGNAPKGARVVIFDLSDTHHPTLLSTLDLDYPHLALSADGKAITDNTNIFDVSDPAHPMRIGDAVQGPPHYGRSHSHPPGFPPISGLDVIDRVMDRALTADEDHLYRVWDITSPGHPQLEREIPCVSLCATEARFLRAPEAVIVIGTPGLDILATAPIEVGGPALLQLHDKFAKLYAAHSLESADLMLPAFTTAMLEDAGVTQLVNQPMLAISAGERVQILSDYGHWRMFTAAPQKGVKALSAVAEASPNDENAWLRLGEAAQFGVLHVASYQDKRSLSLLAMRAYGKHHNLTGIYARVGRSALATMLFKSPSYSVFMGFNPATAPTANVCVYARHLFAHGRDDDEFLTNINWLQDAKEAQKIDITNDGSHLDLKGSGNQFADVLPDSVNIFEPDADVGLSDDLLPFRDGKFYILYRVKHRPYEVALANVGTVCRFHR